jgi:Zn-finger nucleic acid-binding protein
MIGSGYALDAVRRILRDTEARQERLEQRQECRSRFVCVRHKLAFQEEHNSIPSERNPKPITLDVLPKSDRLCPECGQRFAVLAIQGTNIDTCLSCGGIWFDTGELRALTHQTSDVPDKDKLTKRSKYNCPVCGKQMKQHLHKTPHRLLVDACPHGHGTYLEQGEYLKALESTEKAITQHTS